MPVEPAQAPSAADAAAAFNRQNTDSAQRNMYALDSAVETAKSVAANQKPRPAPGGEGGMGGMGAIMKMFGG